MNVTGFDPPQGSVPDLKVGSTALAYDCPLTGDVLIFKLNQAIHIDSMNNNLLCPMQLRMNDVKVFDCPRLFIENPNEYDHTIITLGVDNEEYSIPLSLNGVTSISSTRKPTMDEYNVSCEHHIDLAYDTLE